MASSALRFCCAVATPGRLGSSRSKFAGGLQLPTVSGASRFSMSAEDFGFDPLGLGEVPENLERFKESELIHCRWAMLAVPGILVPEALGLGNWVKAQEWAAVPGGQATYLGNPVPWGTLPTILVIEFLSIAFVEHQRSMEKDPEKKKYPAAPSTPSATPRTPPSSRNTRSRRSRTVSRLALASIRRVLRAAVGVPRHRPLENLATHLADPWHNNIGDIIIPRDILQ
ncbi:unnamed protein product [Spirodela intermedia]|uniref:Chlorophyll a-b binding protein, chloroplastic n=1 Tax=Spirodela intermedia TaxID=51605 RepID=A0A7I8IQ02_SPIIN|nr:unnamed protein product [Spirodela intermedia]CAA6659862.1 unnamed protein product [Spirodela intermedia]